MTDTSNQMPAPKRVFDAESVAVLAAAFAAFAAVASIFAVGLAARAATEARDGAAAPVSAPPAATFELSEFAIDPADTTIDAGAVLHLANVGKTAHNLSVDGVASETIDAGEQTSLDLGSLAPGRYAMQCDVPGHADAGMKGTITIE